MIDPHPLKSRIGILEQCLADIVAVVNPLHRPLGGEQRAVSRHEKDTAAAVLQVVLKQLSAFFKAVGLNIRKVIGQKRRELQIGRAHRSDVRMQLLADFANIIRAFLLNVLVELPVGSSK